jgi:hypothetical protein
MPKKICPGTAGSSLLRRRWRGITAVLSKRMSSSRAAWVNERPRGYGFAKIDVVLRKRVGDCTPVFFANPRIQLNFGANSSRVK